MGRARAIQTMQAVQGARRARFAAPRVICRWLVGVAWLAVATGAKAEPRTTFPGAEWDTKTPAEAGLDEAKINQFVANVGGVGCIVRDGYLVKAWGETSKGDWASAMKPVLSTLLFFAVHERRLPSVDARVKDWGWDLTEKDHTMTFRHLANMLSGYARGEAPAAAYAYNDYAINLYALTMQKVFSQSLDRALRQRLAALQFQDGSIFGSRGGVGLHASPRDFARIGWFWANKGRWNGQQLLPERFFDQHMKPGMPGTLPLSSQEGSDYLGVGTLGGGSSHSRYGPGIYGFNWWFNAKVGTTQHRAWPDAPADTFQANGHWGREVVTIIPSLGLVVAARGDWGEFEPGNPDSGINQNLKLLKEAVRRRPLPGQIMVGPANPRWLVRNSDEDADARLDPFFLCGPGDPEGFLYRGTRNPDGTRNGDQMQLINKIKSTGANCLYLMAVRSHGGDGDKTQNPFVDSRPAKGLDEDILTQWETWFTEMDENGIVIFFFFYDDSARIWDTGDTVEEAERAFIQGLVSRFKHHKHLIWCVAEEYQERYSAARVSNIAAEIRAADDHGHPIAVHKLGGLSFDEFADDPNIDQFAVQYTVNTAERLQRGMVTAWNKAAGRYNLNMSECGGHGSGTAMRKKNWACAMGGAYVMVFEMSYTRSDLEDCGRLVRFMESAGFDKMSPHDDLVNTGWCLANAGIEYIVYLPNGGSVKVDLTAVTGGFVAEWYNPRTGDRLQTGSVLGGEVRSFVAPDANDWVLHVRESPSIVGSQAHRSRVRRGAGLSLLSRRCGRRE